VRELPIGYWPFPTGYSRSEGGATTRPPGVEIEGGAVFNSPLGIEGKDENERENENERESDKETATPHSAFRTPHLAGSAFRILHRERERARER